MKKIAMLLAVVLILGMTLASCTGQSVHMAYVGEGFTMENAEGKTLTCEKRAAYRGYENRKQLPN